MASGNSTPAWQPPATDKVYAPPVAAKPLGFSSQAVPWTPPPSDPVYNGPDLSAYGTPKPPTGGGKPLDFSAQAVPWTPPATDRVISNGPDLSAYGSPNPPPPLSNSPVDAFRNSAGALISGVGKLGNVIDRAIQNNAPAWLAKATGATGDLQNGDDQGVIAAGQAVAGPNQCRPAPVHQLGADVAAGKPGAALNDAAGIVAGAVPYAVAAIPGAGPAILGASAAGNTIDTRMKAQGETSPSAGDIVAGGADAALNAVGGGLAHGVAGGVGKQVISAAARQALGPLADTLLGRIALGGATGGTLGAANNVAADAGTGNLTGQGVLSDAVEGAGTGALMNGPGAAKTALQSVLTERGAAALHPEAAASIVRVADMAGQRVAAAKAAGQSLTPANAMKTIGAQLNGEIAGHVSGLDLSTADRQAVIAPLLQQAKAGTLLPSDAAVPSSPLAQFDSLGLPAGSVTALRNGLLDLSTINRDGGEGRGLLKPVIDKITSHGTARTLEAILGGSLGYHAGGAEGAALGGMAGVALPAAASSLAGRLDALAGTTAPRVLALQPVAQAALRRAALDAGPSSLEALQAARQGVSSPVDAGAMAEAIGRAKAATNQAGLVARYGADHPLGAAALAGLKQAGNDAIANQALAQFAAMSGVRDARAAGVANDTAAKHQLALDAADVTPGGPFDIDAINAASRELSRKATATKRLAGVPQEDSQDSLQAGAGRFAPTLPETPAVAPSGLPESLAAMSGGDRRTSLADYLGHVAVSSPAGVSLTPDDVRAGLDAAAAAGQLTPDQHAFYTAALPAPLDNPGGVHTANLNAILQHAIAVKTGSDGTTAAAGLLPTGPKGSGGGVPNGGERPVRNLHQWQGAADTYQRDIQHRIDAAERAGDDDLAMVLRNIRSTPEVVEKQRIAAAHMARLLDDPVKSAKARAALGGRVLTQGK